MIVSRIQVQQNQNKNKMQNQSFKGTEFARGFTPQERRFLQAAAKRVSGDLNVRVKRPLSVSLASLFPPRIEIARRWEMLISHPQNRSINTSREFDPCQTKQNRREIKQRLNEAASYVQAVRSQEVKWDS